MNKSVKIDTRTRMRLVTSLLWLLVTLAFAFDAVAEPCDLRAEFLAERESISVENMPCHEKMKTDASSKHHEAPSHVKDTCCCAALLTTTISLDRSNLKEPIPGAASWTVPLNDRAKSLLFEYEPPPPRA